jgi:hypothetical protein
MRKIFICINFLIAFSLNAQGQRESYYFIKDTKTDQKIEIGDNLTLLKEKFGDPKEIIYPDKTENRHDDYIYAYYKAFSVKIVSGNNKICEIYITAKGIETYRGLKVGDNVNEVKELFRDKKYKLENFQSTHFLIIDLPLFENDHITEQTIECEYDEKGIIYAITVGGIDWD